MKYLIVLFLSFINYQIFAQYFYFNQFELSNEILDKKPTCLLRNHKDILHIGTENGLINFDGYSYDILLRKGAASQYVTAMYHDGHTLWIGYNDGALYFLENFEFKPFLRNGVKRNSKITGIVKDKSGQIWVSTYGEGVFVYTKDQTYNFNKDSGIGSDDIYSITTDRYDKIYISNDEGIYYCQIKGSKKSVKKLNLNSEIEGDIIQKISYDSFRHLLYASSYDEGMWEIDLKTNLAKKVENTSGKVQLYTHAHNQLICSSYENEENSFYIKRKNTTEKVKADGIDGELIPIDMYLDQEGSLWVLCKNNGLLMANTSFVTFSSMIDNIQAIKKSDNDILIGCENGLFAISKEGNQKVLIKNENILSLYVSKTSNKIWAGSFGNGIFIIDINHQVVKRIQESNGLINDNVFSIVEHKNDIWISTLAGVQQIGQDGILKKSWNKNSGLSSDYNYTLFSDSKNNLWVGSDGEGLAYFDSNDSLHKVSNKQTIISITEDVKGRIWFSTLNKGLGYFENEKLFNFDMNNGLSSLQVSGISSDAKGNVFVFQNRGLDIIDAKTMHVRHLGKNLGFTRWVQNINAFHLDDSNIFTLSHKDKLIRFDPSILKLSKPKLVIKSMKCGRHRIQEGLVNYFDFDQNDFQIEYTGVWMNDPKSVTYGYKMLPMDKDWRYTKDVKLVYSNLRPGSYEFYIQCSTNHRYDSFESTPIKFKIYPAFWQTVWFYIISVSLFVGLILWWTNSKNKTEKMIQELKTEQIKSQLETLKSQINPHFLFNSFNTLISTIEEKPKEAVVYVEKLSDFYRSVLQYRYNDLIKLKEELILLDNYRYLLFQRFGDHLIFNVELDEIGDTLIFPLTFQILIENAVKHNIISASKPLRINIFIIDDKIKICNNLQPRLSTEKSTYFGLQALNRRYMSITGKEIVIDHMETEFCVTIPIIKK